jgi:hypothetical protein
VLHELSLRTCSFALSKYIVTKKTVYYFTLAVLVRQNSGDDKSPTTTALDAQSTSSVSKVNAGIRVDHCSIVRNDILYVFGGRLPPSSSSSSTNMPLFAAYNLTAHFDDPKLTGTWTEMPSLNAIPVLNPQCVLTDTHLVIVGGQPVNSSLINPFASNAPMTYCGLQAFSFAENGWQSLMPEGNLGELAVINLNRTGHAASWLEDIGDGSQGLFVMGGLHFNATLPANDAFILNPFVIPAIGGQAIIGASSIANNLPPPTIGSGSAVVNNGRAVLFFGGRNVQTGEVPKGIWELNSLTKLWTALSVSLPQGMPHAGAGFVTPQDSLVTIDVSQQNTGTDVVVVPLSSAGVKRRQLTSPSSPPGKMDGTSVTFDLARNIGIVTGGDGAEGANLNIFNATDNTWSQVAVQIPLQLTSTSTTASSTAKPTPTSPIILVPSSSSSTQPTLLSQPAATNFTKSNILAPIILGSILGALGLIGLILLLISYQRRRAAKSSTRTSVSPAALWLKYGNNGKDNRNRPAPPNRTTGQPPFQGEIFLRNLEEKHGLRRGASERGRAGWSKYFTASWYRPDPRASGDTTDSMAQALVRETREHSGPYGGGWDANSTYSKASSFISMASRSSRGPERGSSRWSSGLRWSYGNKKPRASNASSGVLGSTLGVSEISRPARI